MNKGREHGGDGGKGRIQGEDGRWRRKAVEEDKGDNSGDLEQGKKTRGRGAGVLGYGARGKEGSEERKCRRG